LVEPPDLVGGEDAGEFLLGGPGRRVLLLRPWRAGAEDVGPEPAGQVFQLLRLRVAELQLLVERRVAQVERAVIHKRRDRPAGGRRSPGAGTPATSPGRSPPRRPAAPGRPGARRAPGPTAGTARCRPERVGRGLPPAPPAGRGSTPGPGWRRSAAATPGTT